MHLTQLFIKYCCRPFKITRGNPLLHHGQFLPLSSKGTFICIITQADLPTSQYLLLVGIINRLMGMLDWKQADVHNFKLLFRISNVTLVC